MPLELFEPRGNLLFPSKNILTEKFMTSNDSKKQDGFNLDYEVNVSLSKSLLEGSMDLQITMERKGMRNFIENILPPGLLVVVSWVSQPVLLGT